MKFHYVNIFMQTTYRSTEFDILDAMTFRMELNDPTSSDYLTLGIL